MSSFLKVRTALLTLAMFGSAAAAEAEPIRGLGTLLGDHDIITVNLRSRARDFSLFGSAAPIFGFWGPACVGDCLPGEQRSLDAAFTGGDFVGRLSIDGRDYRFGFFSDQLGEAGVRFQGTWTAPEFTGRTRATVIRPFTFEGYFRYPMFDHRREPEEMEGSGTRASAAKRATGMERAVGAASE
jgi:hypothetical protein